MEVFDGDNLADSLEVLGDGFFNFSDEVRLGCSADCFSELALNDALESLVEELVMSGRRDEDGTERLLDSLR